MPVPAQQNQAVNILATPLHNAYLVVSWPVRVTAEKITELIVSFFVDVFHTFWRETMQDGLLVILQEVLEEDVKPGMQQIVDYVIDHHTIYIEHPLGAFHVRIPRRTPSNRAQFINRRPPPIAAHVRAGRNVGAPPIQQQSRIIYYLTLPICGPVRAICYLAKRVILSMVGIYWRESLRSDIKQKFSELWHGTLQIKLQDLLQDNIEKRKLAVHIPGGMELHFSLTPIGN